MLGPVLLASILSAPLPVPGWAAAEHVVPSSSAPRPVVVVLHGDFDRPEAQCAEWRLAVRGRAFILCPRGIARPGPARPIALFRYASAEAAAGEVASARAALVSRYGRGVASGPDVSVGFSLGAAILAQIAITDPAGHPRVFLQEGGLGPWNEAAARRFAANGGEKVAIACGTSSCRARAARVVTNLSRAGVPVRLVFAPVGHAYGGALRRPTGEAFDWLVAGDGRFRF